ncbi:methyltransferase domain-containing protein [Gammaproteobacteria bacterium]|nr:methyltransferase domain-containing protein [Gammaproteobacteria bacterium]MDA9040464.1 methyltransferase domain-containing protein [Gammaproteobacteria bacterium]MDA9053989.1 methyltransferase domain-containing protein [Gammaproteobacteria bacterium]
MKTIFNKIILMILISSIPNLSAHDLQSAVNSEDRDSKNVARDSSRHPMETLSFFEIKSDMTIIELSPGGGWYTEILANFLHEPGNLIAAHFDPNSERAYFKRSRANFEKKMSANSMFDNVQMSAINSNLAKPNSVDAVLTFRNLHNWLGAEMDLIFSNSYKALKPGGIFGVVEHRAKPGTSMDVMKKSGYVTEEHAIEIARKHGFELVAKSEINANPKDTKNYPGGVWTLPPNLRLKDLDREKYLEIGESDRMTLLFKKPLES